MDKKPDDDNPIKRSVREEFPSFVHGDTGTKGDDDLATKFLQSIDSVSIFQQQMCGQGYGGASILSVHVGGVQTKIYAIIPSTFVSFIRKRYELSIMPRYLYPSKSLQRYLGFQEQLEHNAPSCQRRNGDTP